MRPKNSVHGSLAREYLEGRKRKTIFATLLVTTLIPTSRNFQ